MDDLLDDGNIVSRKKASYLVKLAWIYIFIMLVGSFLYTVFNFPELSFTRIILFVLAFLFIPVVISGFIVFINILFLEIRKKETKRKLPLWYKLIEGMFSIWVGLIIIVLIISSIRP